MDLEKLAEWIERCYEEDPEESGVTPDLGSLKRMQLFPGKKKKDSK